jgi:hypothetical protein
MIFVFCIFNSPVDFRITTRNSHFIALLFIGARAAATSHLTRMITHKKSVGKTDRSIYLLTDRSKHGVLTPLSCLAGAIERFQVGAWGRCDDDNQKGRKQRPHGLRLKRFNTSHPAYAGGNAPVRIEAEAVCLDVEGCVPEALGSYYLIILDSADITAGPVATIHAPYRLKNAIHNAWLDREPAKLRG